MFDVLSVLWTIISFVIGILWAIVWFILRDLLSTVMWIGIVIWLAFVVRYRNFYGGTMAILRYARHGVKLVWQWLRGKPQDAPLTVPGPVVREYRDRIPFGYVSLSEQMNVVLIGLLAIMLSL